MNRRRVGEDRGSKETDGCPLTTCLPCSQGIVWDGGVVIVVIGV
jgi:hypothetical protein